ncbi:hypothetical protein ACRAWF_22010 [Streptomyces sp. L7]
MHTGRPERLDPLGEVEIGFPQWVNRIGAVSNALLLVACAVFVLHRLFGERARVQHRAAHRPRPGPAARLLRRPARGTALRAAPARPDRGPPGGGRGQARTLGTAGRSGRRPAVHGAERGRGGHRTGHGAA